MIVNYGALCKVSPVCLSKKKTTSLSSVCGTFSDDKTVRAQSVLSMPSVFWDMFTVFRFLQEVSSLTGNRLDTQKRWFYVVTVVVHFKMHLRVTHIRGGALGSPVATSDNCTYRTHATNRPTPPTIKRLFTVIFLNFK